MTPSFPTAITHPSYRWQRLQGQPTTVFAFVPAHAERFWLYVYSERTGQTYERLCSDPKRANLSIVDFSRQYG